MMRGIAASLKLNRLKYFEIVGHKWKGSDEQLRIIIRSSCSMGHTISKMQEVNAKALSDDPSLRPLGSVSDKDLIAELRMRPNLSLGRRSANGKS